MALPGVEERIDFPASWDLHVMDMAGHNLPILTPQQIAEQSSQPIGTKSLSELAAGKKTVAISFDDLTRTTPAYAVTPWLMSELSRAGIKDENILFIGSFGTHRAMTRKRWAGSSGRRSPGGSRGLTTTRSIREGGRNHLPREQILLNQTFLASDLKICISGVKVHPDLGQDLGVVVLDRGERRESPARMASAPPP